MSDDRLRRAGRLVDLRERAVDAAQKGLAVASAARAEASARASASQRRWSAQAAAMNTVTEASSDELREAWAYLDTLRRALDADAARSDAAATAEKRAQSALSTARAELRKLELWRDRLLQAERERDLQLERRGADETAARVARREP